MQELKAKIREALEGLDEVDRFDRIHELREFLSELSHVRDHPVDLVRWVPIERVSPNDYNPNRVAPVEMNLLHTSISHDGYTQPIVTVYDPESDRYVIVDGFHRYYVCKMKEDVRSSTHGRVPIVVLDKPINDRMASTVRHNRARGKHQITGMANMVFEMLENGWKDEEICNELGMEAEELARLKHVTGFAKLFENAEYRRAWVGRRQVKLKGAQK